MPCYGASKESAASSIGSTSTGSIRPPGSLAPTAPGSFSQPHQPLCPPVRRRISPGYHPVIIMPEGRMMRANGLDKNSRAMTVRGGIADIVRSIPPGLLLLRPGAGISAGLCGLSRINLPAATLMPISSLSPSENNSPTTVQGVERGSFAVELLMGRYRYPLWLFFLIS